MTDLNRALVEIRNIRRQVAQTAEFRGYGPATLFATSVVAVIAGVMQARWLPQPAAHQVQYVALWLSTAVFCAALIGSQMLARANRLHSSMAPEMVQIAVTQFLPTAIAGAILPFVLLRDQSIIWLLPGLWQILTGLGIFACCRTMPRAMLLAGAWFLFTGFSCIALGDRRALAPITMSGAYCVGMVLVAAIHYYSARKALDEEDMHDENE